MGGELLEGCDIWARPISSSSVAILVEPKASRYDDCLSAECAPREVVANELLDDWGDGARTSFVLLVSSGFCSSSHLFHFALLLHMLRSQHEVCKMEQGSPLPHLSPLPLLLFLDQLGLYVLCFFATLDFALVKPGNKLLPCIFVWVSGAKEEVGERVGRGIHQVRVLARRTKRSVSPRSLRHAAIGPADFCVKQRRVFQISDRLLSISGSVQVTHQNLAKIQRYQ